MCKQLQIKKLNLKPIWVSGHSKGFIIPKRKFNLDMTKRYVLDVSEECIYIEADNDG